METKEQKRVRYGRQDKGFDPFAFRLAVKQSVQYNRWLGKNMLVLIYKRNQRILYPASDNSLKAVCRAVNSRIYRRNIL